MTFFTASFDTVVLRFCLMMASVIVPFVLGVPFLAIIALPIFLSAMTAVSFKSDKKRGQVAMKAYTSPKVINRAA